MSVSPGICREIANIVLGRFRNLGYRPLGGELSAETRKRIAICVYSKVKEKADLEDSLKLILSPPINAIELLARCIPAEALVLGANLTIKDEEWEKWLEICWGNDQDIMCMLAYLQKNPQVEDIVDVARRMPLVPRPEGASYRSKLIDEHIHAGALGFPCLTWAYFMNKGTAVAETNVSLESGGLERYIYARAIQDSKIQLYACTARILLASLLELRPRRQMVRGDPSPSSFMKIVRGILEKRKDPIKKVQYERQDLADDLIENLNFGDDSHSRVSSSVSSGTLHKCDLHSFLRMERSQIARLLWLAHARLLHRYAEEVFLTYLRCKGYWFQACTGQALGKHPLRLSGLKFCAEQARLESETDNRLSRKDLTRAIRYYYMALESERELYVKLPMMRWRKRVSETLDWIDEALGSTPWSIIPCIVRKEPQSSFLDVNRNRYERTSALGPGDTEEEMREFINTIAQTSDCREKIIGIDIVGPERDFSWKQYPEILRNLREHATKVSGNRCFIAFHCGEDTRFPLKGISDTWYVIEKANLGRCDRVAHAIDLLYPIRHAWRGDALIKHWQWDILEDSITSICEFMDDQSELEKDKSRDARDLLRKLRTDRKPLLEEYRLDRNDVLKLTAIIWPIVVQRLIDRHIRIETCPTSNWRITRKAFPTRHRIGWWISRKRGKYGIGTDDPAILPCTIATERYSVDRSIDRYITNS